MRASVTNSLSVKSVQLAQECTGIKCGAFYNPETSGMAAPNYMRSDPWGKWTMGITHPRGVSGVLAGITGCFVLSQS